MTFQGLFQAKLLMHVWLGCNATSVLGAMQVSKQIVMVECINAKEKLKYYISLYNLVIRDIFRKGSYNPNFCLKNLKINFKKSPKSTNSNFCSSYK